MSSGNCNDYYYHECLLIKEWIRVTINSNHELDAKKEWSKFCFFVGFLQLQFLTFFCEVDQRIFPLNVIRYLILWAFCIHKNVYNNLSSGERIFFHSLNFILGQNKKWSLSKAQIIYYCANFTAQNLTIYHSNCKFISIRFTKINPFKKMSFISEKKRCKYCLVKSQ